MMPAQPSRPAKSESDDGRLAEFKRVAEIYAIRSRELSEAVSTLGGHLAAGRPFEESITEIRRLRGLCESAGEDFFRFVSSLQASRPSASYGGRGEQLTGQGGA
jgi:hypothetical protein